MRPALMNLQVGLPHLLIWIAIVGILVAGCFFFRRSRRCHPKVAQRESSYSARLERRMADARRRADRPGLGDARPKLGHQPGRRGTQSLARERLNELATKQAAPTQIAMSATLNAGQCQPARWKSRKSVTLPNTKRSMALPTAPPRIMA